MGRSGYPQQLQELGSDSSDDNDREIRKDLEARIQLKGEESDTWKRRCEEESNKLIEMEECARNMGELIVKNTTLAVGTPLDLAFLRSPLNLPHFRRIPERFIDSIGPFPKTQNPFRVFASYGRR
jgi:hypothetical protein